MSVQKRQKFAGSVRRCNVDKKQSSIACTYTSEDAQQIADWCRQPAVDREEVSALAVVMAYIISGLLETH